MYCWSLSWRILSITLLTCEMRAIVWQFEHSLALPFFGIEIKIDLCQSCGHCWVFQTCWHIECYSTFTASSFRIWNNSTGIPSPPLALFIVMLLKAHLTLHSRIPGSRCDTSYVDQFSRPRVGLRRVENKRWRGRWRMSGICSIPNDPHRWSSSLSPVLSYVQDHLEPLTDPDFWHYSQTPS